jgi:hypothetical protein
MNTQLLLEKKHAALKNELSGNLHRKHSLELKINEQFEQLKRIEISLERHVRTIAAEG